MGGKSSVIPGESQASLAWPLILCNRTGCEGHQEGQRSVNGNQRDWRGFGYKVAPAISWNPMGVSSENQKLGWGELRGERKKKRPTTGLSVCQCASLPGGKERSACPEGQRRWQVLLPEAGKGPETFPHLISRPPKPAGDSWAPEVTLPASFCTSLLPCPPRA